MGLKNFLFASLLLGGMTLNTFGKEKLNVYSEPFSFFGIRPPIGQIEIDRKSIDASFLFGAYNIRMEQLNDSCYSETIIKKFPLKRGKEIFFYKKKGENYFLMDYVVPYGQRRREKDSLLYLENFIGAKNLTPVEAISKLSQGDFEDSLHFFVMGCKYSLPLKKEMGAGDRIKYHSDLSNIVKINPEDGFSFDSIVEVNIFKKRIEGFSTSYRTGDDSQKKKIEGKK